MPPLTRNYCLLPSHIPALASTTASSVKTTASNVFQEQTSHYGPREAFDQDAETRRATDSGTRRAWIMADLGKAKAIQRLRISETYEGCVQEFEFQYRDGRYLRAYRGTPQLL